MCLDANKLLLTTTENTITYHKALFVTPKFCISIVFSFSQGHFDSLAIGVANKEHYGMVCYFLQWSIAKCLSVLQRRFAGKFGKNHCQRMQKVRFRLPNIKKATGVVQKNNWLQKIIFLNGSAGAQIALNRELSCNLFKQPAKFVNSILFYINQVFRNLLY